MATATSPEGSSQSRSADEHEARGEGIDEITADDLRQIVRALGLVEIPERLMPKVLEHVRSHRESLRKFAAAEIDLTGVVTAQPFRA